MPKFRIAKEKEKQEDTIKRPQQNRQVQKSDRINSDRQSDSDQLGSPRIMKKKKTKLNEIEIFTHLKVKIPVKNGPN